MAIAFDAAAHSRGSGINSLTFSHPCTGSDRALFVAVVGNTTSDVITGVTYNLVPMTLVGKVQNTSGARWDYLYYLNAPATGAHDIVISASSSIFIEGNSASYTGVNQTGQPEANATNSGGSSSTTLTTTVTTTTDNAWTVLAAMGQGGTITAGAGSTLRATDLVGAIFDSGGAVTPAGSKSMTFTQAAQYIGGVIAAIAPAASSDTITITTPTQYTTRQRSGTTGSIAITVNWSGAPTAIEASFNGGAYQTIIGSPTGGTGSGTLTGQAQGQGTLTVRFSNNTAVNATVADIGIGDVFVVAGDSISEGRGTNAQSYTHATLKATKFRQDDAWGNGNDGIDTGTSNGSHWPLLATQMLADLGVPVAFISCGTGSTDVAGTANSWAKNNTEYAGMVQQVTDSGSGGVKACLFHLGPNAVVNASTLSQATYNAALDTLAADIAADIAGAPKLFVGLCGEVNTGSPPDRRAALNNIRGAIVQAWGDNANIKPGPVLIDQDYTDGVHPASDAELAAVAKRWWVAIKEALYSGPNGRGPRLSSASWNVARNELTVVFDRNLKTALTHSTAAWIVSDNGTPMTISSIAYHGSNAAALVFTMSAAAVGAAGTTTVSFASGDDAKGLVVPLSTDITMPSGAAINIPAEPIYAAAVAESSIGAFSVTTDTVVFSGGANVSPLSAFSATLADVVFSGGAQVSPLGSFSITTDAIVFAGGAQVSPRASCSDVLSDIVFSGGATSGTGGFFTIESDSVVFSGGARVSPLAEYSSVLADVVFSGGASSGAAMKTASVTLTTASSGGSPAASLTGLKWAWFDEVTPNLFVAPTDQGTGETTDGSGVLTVDIPNSAKSSGQVGWLIVTDSDGTTTQSPPHKAFSGPVAVN